MLTTLAHREVETGGTTEVGTFSIKANGKAFKVLIDGLYSDKARAVVRELWSNAFDSHIAAGCADKPFDCHLPTVWEPWFTVRDFGVSMTHVGVMRLYTTVFESSKEDTNTQVGKLGLGSKSPFAYTDTFTVTAYLDGEKRTYSAFIGADYIPRIAHMSTTETTEPNGLEVSFPVKTDDIANFQIAAQRTALGFDVLPNIVGSDQLSVGKKKVILSGTGWTIYDSLGGQTAHAKQGCVVYPINAASITGLPQAHWDILNSPILIEFPIGDLEIAASREGLGYDDTTIRNIRARLDAIEGEVVASVDKQLASIKTPHELMLWMAGTTGDYNVPKVVRALLNKAKWRGRTPSDHVLIRTKSIRANVLLFSAHTLRRYVNIAKQASTSSDFRYSPAKDHAVVCFRDTSVHVPGALTRAHHFMKNSRPNRGMTYISANLKTDPGAFKRLLVAMGRPDPADIVMVNTLPALPSTASGVKAPVKVRVFSDKRRDVRDWAQTDIDANAGGIYINLDRFNIKHGEKDVSYDSADKIVTALKAAGLIDGDVYAIPRSLAKKYLKDENGWTNLFDLAQSALDNNFDAQRAADHKFIKAYVDTPWRIDSITDFVKMLATFPEVAKTLVPGKFHDVVMPYVNYREQLTKDAEQDSWLAIATALGVSLPASKIAPKVAWSDDKVHKQYPVLRMILDRSTSYLNDDDVKIIVDYVNMIDSQ